ncbi:MAG TPA: FtsX-like permease family protein [Ktedonobacteraceae bacterium]
MASKSSQRAGHHPVTSIVTLALWRWRQHWFLLCMIGLGIIASVIIVCSVPLLATTMSTAGLRDVLRASPGNSEISVNANVSGLSTQGVQQDFQAINRPLKSHIGTYLHGDPRLDVSMTLFKILSPAPPSPADRLDIYGTSIAPAASHVKLISGRLPVANSSEVEIAITPQMAVYLHLKVGSVITLNWTVLPRPQSPNPIYVNFPMHVVGLISVNPGDSFWHGLNFIPFPVSDFVTQYSVLASEQNLLTALDGIAAQNHIEEPFFFFEKLYLTFYYQLDPARISVDQLDDLMKRLAAEQADIANTYSNPSTIYFSPSYIGIVNISGSVLHVPGFPSTLERFHSQLVVARISVAILGVQILCLLLFFAGMMAALLVDRQADAITLLRSRGASRRQVLGAFLTQSVGLSIIALIIGPPLAVILAYSVTLKLLPASAADAANVITNAPMAAILNVAGYAIAAALIIIATMMFSLYRASQGDVWATARSQGSSPQATGIARRPIWQRFNLDIVAMIIALTAYGVSVYLSSISNLLDAQTQTLVVSPLALLAPIFLLLAGVLLFLRIFPLLLHLGSGLITCSRGAVPMLALAQMSRTPRQAMRMILLLALAVAFAMFTLVFAATQQQRAYDVAAYSVGADFSGTIPIGVNHPSLQDEIALYTHVHGIIAATTGYVEEDASSANAGASLIQVLAIDPGTFGKATFLLSQNPSQSPDSLLAQLAAQRTEAIQSGVIPAIVDTSTASTLNLHVGSSFSAYKAGRTTQELHYVVIDVVQHIPGVNNATQIGMMVDYSSFAALTLKNYSEYISENYVWLHTSNDAASLANVRTALNTPALHLEDLQDRAALSTSLRTDPLAVNLLALLVIGETTALLLAVGGNLLTSWLNVRRRLTNFTVFRALGAAPGQIASVLTWEQSIIYGTALLLGTLFGALLAITAVPTLVLSGLPINAIVANVSNNQWFALQQTIPFQIVVPASLAIAAAALIIICVGVLGMMIRVVLRPSMTRVLRIDENSSSEFLLREDPIFVRSKGQQGKTRFRRQRARPSMLTLAFWQMRQVGFLLLVQGIAMVAAVTIVCTVPLFSTVTNTAELHTMLTASPTTSEISLDTFTQGLSSGVMEKVQQQTSAFFQQHLGSFLSNTTTFSIQSGGFTPVSSKPTRNKDQVRLLGTSTAQSTPYIQLVQGRLPASTTDGNIETLLTPTTAQHLHVTTGSSITLQGDFFTDPRNMFGGPAAPSSSMRLHLLVVGLFTIPTANAWYWHGQDFEPVQQSQAFSYSLLVSNEALLAAIDHLTAAAHADTVFSPQTFELLWRYRLDTSRVTVNQVDRLSSELSALQTGIENTFGNVQSNETQADGSLQAPYLAQVNVFTPVAGSFDITNTLDQYRNHTAAVTIPIAILTLQIFGLMLLLVSLVANLLVERQADAIDMLRSRGASSGQVFSALLTQSTVLGIIAFVGAPLLAVIIVSLVAQRILGMTAQNAIPLNSGSLTLAALSVALYAAGTILVVLIVMFFLLRSAVSRNFLDFRRELARTTQRPFWQRLHLDVVAALIALTGYGISLYISNISNLFDARTKALISTPLALVAPIFLLIGALILFLRFFSSLLQLGERLAVRGRGAISMLAIAQMARSPRQALRMTLLLALAIAFAIFTLVFSASQSQHIAAIAAYESGADFSGDIPVARQITTKAPWVKDETALYSHISGVLSASAGFSATGTTSGTSPTIRMQIRAVDANTFAQVAAVQHIPSVNNSSTPGSASSTTLPGGVLFDYTTFSSVYLQDLFRSGSQIALYPPINHVWLRTNDDASSLAHVRTALTAPGLHLENLYDRRMLAAGMSTDPLYLSIIIILMVGAATALLLALVGNLLASWQSVRARLTNFAVLRSLGATFGQITSVLLWEQGIVYIAALLLGVIFGAVLSATAVPLLTFTSTPDSGVLSSISNDEFYAIQQIIPAQIILPLSLGLAFLALVVICVLALGTMAGVALRPSVSQTLRLNTD